MMRPRSRNGLRRSSRSWSTPRRVRLVTGDTGRVQAGGGSASARSMRVGSWVIAKAADAIASVDDCGRTVNPLLIHGQSQRRHRAGDRPGAMGAVRLRAPIRPAPVRVAAGLRAAACRPATGFRYGDQRGTVDDTPARHARRQRGRDHAGAGGGRERRRRCARRVRRRAYPNPSSGRERDREFGPSRRLARA
jgi:hypothetical protein